MASSFGHASYVDMLFFFARYQPSHPAMMLGDRVATYKNMASAVLAVENRITKLSLEPGEIVFSAIESPIRYMILAAALYRLGHPLLVVPSAHLALGIKEAKVHFVERGHALSLGLRSVLVTDEWFDPSVPVSSASSAPGFPSRDSICVIYFSSGTTGTPQPKMLSVDAFQQRLADRFLVINRGVWERLLSVLGVNGSWGFHTAAHSLFAGRTLLLAGSPKGALEIADVYNADGIIASANHLRDLVSEYDKNRMSLQSLKFIVTGGGPVSHDIVLKAQQKFVKNVINSYSSTEAGDVALATFDVLNDYPKATGILIPNKKVKTVERTITAGRSNTKSEIAISSAASSRPYSYAAVTNPQKNDDWVYPGDCGFIDQNQMLLLDGRAAELVNIGGLKVSLPKIDEKCLEFPGVEDAASFFTEATGNSLETLYIAIKSDNKFDVEKFRLWIEKNGLSVADIIPVNQIPRLQLGKVDRNGLREIVKQR